MKRQVCSQKKFDCTQSDLHSDTYEFELIEICLYSIDSIYDGSWTQVQKLPPSADRHQAIAGPLDTALFVDLYTGEAAAAGPSGTSGVPQDAHRRRRQSPRGKAAETGAASRGLQSGLQDWPHAHGQVPHTAGLHRRTTSDAWSDMLLDTASDSLARSPSGTPAAPANLGYEQRVGGSMDTSDKSDMTDRPTYT